jgi:hypothetical protein
MLYLSFSGLNRRNQANEDEVCKACSMQGDEEKYVYGFGGKDRGKETTRKTDACGRIILKLM